MNPGDTSPRAGQVQLDALRKMGPEKRLAAGIALTQVSLDLMKTGIAARHPEYSEQQCRLALIRMLLPERLFQAAYSEADRL